MSLPYTPYTDPPPNADLDEQFTLPETEAVGRNLTRNTTPGKDRNQNLHNLHNLDTAGLESL